MKFNVKQVEKYGKVVWQHSEMDELRKTQCLCLNCSKMKSCSAAKVFYEKCQMQDMALAVTRCPNFIQIKAIMPFL